MKILDIQHVDKVYGSRDIPVRALSDVSFSAEQGEFAAIVGGKREREKHPAEPDRRA